MALDPTLSLKVINPLDAQTQAIANQTAQAKLSDMPTQVAQRNQQFGQETQGRDLDIKAKELANKLKQTQVSYGLLSNAVDQPSYTAAKAQASQMGLDVTGIPDQYDPNFVKQSLYATLDAKDRLELEQKKLDSQFKQTEFNETQRHHMAVEGIDNKKADNPFGNSLTGHAYQTLMTGDPNSQQYALAYNAATQPKYQNITNADGTTQLAAVAQSLPSSIRAPGGVVQPPPVAGTKDTTPSTPTNQLLPPPTATQATDGFSVTPIAGTKAPAKFSENESNAALYATRMENADQTISKLLTNGYKPSLATDSLGDSKVGNALLTQSGQQFTQAKRDFATAVLRRESGAAISPSEFATVDKQYFPQPNDDSAVLKDKAKLRQTAINGIKKAAGSAYNSSGNTNFSNMSDDEIRKHLGL